MDNDLFLSAFDRNSSINKKIHQELKTFAFKEYLLPILPVAIKEGINGYVDCEEQHISIKDIFYNYFVEVSPDKNIAEELMKQFLHDCAED